MNGSNQPVCMLKAVCDVLVHTDTLGSHSYYLLKFIVYSEVVSGTVMYGGMDVFIVWRIDLDEDRVSTVNVVRPINGDDTLRTHY
ncbi:hypothetical protein BDV36DRAFT_277614 [Aspergillus pseudocaelatus]|uniref:Uncharacterized protein n=1 Tax=Aspergillus pseudocaelatus TaxID=1825620 RepID=A0ABQ6W555_9EURO|nr:hypothetical protein BDV36DRAFT_277614 [Aspergillus pseudocaelatus]